MAIYKLSFSPFFFEPKSRSLDHKVQNFLFWCCFLTSVLALMTDMCLKVESCQQNTYDDYYLRMFRFESVSERNGKKTQAPRSALQNGVL